MIAFLAVLLATVTSTSSTVSYACNGTTKVFSIPFPYVAPSDILAQQLTSTGATITLTIGTSYSIRPSIATTSGTLTLASPCDPGSTLTISRSMPLTQPQAFRTGSYQGGVHEQAFDRGMMGEQQLNTIHNADKATQATKDASQDAAIVGVGNSVAGLNSSSQAVTSTSSVLAFGTTTPRTLTVRWGDYPTAADSNAKCDGTTDDTTAIQAAVTAAAGKTLRFIGPATCKLTGRINVPTGTKLVAEGAVTLNQTTLGQVVFYGTGVSSIEIRGFTMTGPGSATQPITGTSNNCGAICFETSGTNILVERNIISGFFNGISGTNINGFTVRGNEVSHWRLYAVLASISSDFHIDNNRLHDNDMPTGTAWSASTTYALGDTATSNFLMWMSLHAANINNAPPAGPPGDTHWLQIATYGIMATGARPTTLQSRNTITFNKIANNPVWDAIMTHDCDGLIIVGNDARGVRNGIDLSSSTAGKYVDRVLVSDNYFEATTTDAWSGLQAKNTGINLFGNDSTIRARNVSITGNILNGFNFANAGVQANGGITLSNTEGVVISGNRILGTGGFAGNVGGGIVANGVGNAMVISGNTIETAAAIPPVLFNALTSDTISVSGNGLKDANGTCNAVKAQGANVITDLALTGNTTNCTAAPYSLAGTFTRVKNDWAHVETPQKWTDVFVSPTGPEQGAYTQWMIAPSAGLTNVDLLTINLTTVTSSVAAIEVEVTGQVSSTTGLVKWTYTAYATRNGSADAVWTPAAATSMFVVSRVGGDPAAALGAVYGTITAPKLIINQVSASIGTLQFQPQVGFASYLIRARASSWRGTVSPL